MREEGESIMKQQENVASISCPNCQKFVDILYLILDNEATEEQKDFFRFHIDKCAKCLEHYQIEKALWDKIKIKLDDKKCCPDCLVDTIREKIKQ